MRTIVGYIDKVKGEYVKVKDNEREQKQEVS